jgi:hypothetical protein
MSSSVLLAPLTSLRRGQDPSTEDHRGGLSTPGYDEMATAHYIRLEPVCL